jgi:hypothetical protein
VIQNSDFSQAGAASGGAAHWRLDSRTSRVQIAAFGPLAHCGGEDFERWFLHTASQYALAFWSPTGAGFEDWAMGWRNDAFLWALPGQLALGLIESWTETLWLAWSQISSRPAVFGKASTESFEQAWPTDGYLGAWESLRALPAWKEPETFEDSAWQRLRL